MSMHPSQLDILCSAIARQNAEGKSSNFNHAIRCFSLDTITTVCFAKSMDATLMPDFESPVVIAMDNAAPMLKTFAHFPLLRSILSKIPPSALMALNGTVKGYSDIRAVGCFFVFSPSRECSSHTMQPDSGKTNQRNPR